MIVKLVVQVVPVDPVKQCRMAASEMRCVRTDFSFVGILEEYDLSVCLFRSTFGGPCQSFMFDNVHLAGNHGTVTQNTSSTHYNTAVLQDFEDCADRALYNYGSDIFAQTLLRYDVTVASCQPYFL